LLGWRGAAKTTFCTISRCIFEILQNPNVRILLASEAVDQSKIFLRSIKSHFENNERFREIFGDYVKGASVWAETEITVNKRTSHAGESTILCTGMGTALPSRHFDIIIVDDLVTMGNSATEGQRKRTLNYYYATLLPTLDTPHGRLWVIGTRWHEEDLHGHLQKFDFASACLVVSALDPETDCSRWEEKISTERLHRYRRANPETFALQYMLHTTIGEGKIFTFEHFRYYETLPDDVFFWQGVDLAIGLQDQHDFFAHVTLAVQKTTRVPYLVSYRKKRLTFPQQVEFLAQRFKDYPATVRVVIEENNYQRALRQQLRESHPEVPAVGRSTIKDKVARAQQLTAIFTDRPLHILYGHSEFLELICGFPVKKGSKDVFDALDLAIGQGLKGAKKRRRKEPGLI